MRFGNRIKRLEKSISEIRLAQSGFRVCFQEHGQTQTQAMEAAGIDEDDNALTIFVMHWSEKPLPGDMPYPGNTVTPANRLDIDAKIARLKDELRADGMSGRQLAELEGKLHALQAKNG